MTYEQEFLKDFEAWVVTQVKVNETALAASKKIWEEDGDERARDASYRYEAKLDAFFTTWFSSPATWFWLIITGMIYCYVGYDNK